MLDAGPLEVPSNGTYGAAGERPVPNSGTVSATRVADVLLMLTSGPDRLRVTDVARELGISKAVVHRILQSLAARQLVSADPASGTYSLGPAAAALGARALQSIDLRTAAMPILRWLHAHSRETTTMAALVGSARVHLEQVVSLNVVHMEVELGRPWPLHAGAPSKAILAVAPPDLRREVLDGQLPRITSTTVTDRMSLAAELKQIAVEGVAVSQAERQPGAGSVAAPVFGLHGGVVGSIAVCGPISRFDSSTIAKTSRLVRTAAAHVSQRLLAPV
jgi:IclR family transcriptional regulator, acetate operon repressor